MPKRSDIKSVLLIGSGPIIIGQACEFDYSGTQAIKALKQEGFRVILINSNPATIMTDPEFADATYIEPITPEFVERIIAVEKPDAVLPTMGGQTALNTALALQERGVFERYKTELIGASVEAIKTAEDRERFRVAMEEIGLESARSGIAHSTKDAEEIAKKIGYPLILRPSRTLGGVGGGIVKDPSELVSKVGKALAASPIREVLIEESLLGWKEIELEVMRDKKDNVVIICGIENLDPMGVHTGDSITVAPIQTLTDKEYQLLRDASIRIMRKIGVETGGSNVQFALNPKNGRVVVIEMNPRVSRSSALASKATGFPIARIAAKLAVGYTLDEIPNDITKRTPSCFEPSIDYVVVKIPRFNFEKFPFAEPVLGTQMKSVGESMAFGRCFSEALQKAMNSLELGSYGFDMETLAKDLGVRELLERCRTPSPERLWYVAEAIRLDISVKDLFEATNIDPWFLSEIERLVKWEGDLKGKNIKDLPERDLLELKRLGFSDKRLSVLLNIEETEVSAYRRRLGIHPAYKAIDTCAAEFEAETPYLYSSYDQDNEARPTSKRKVIILGSGPNRIGQGIEFDYCCVHAVFALKDLGIEAIMVNCNPETVSTDYDISDRLYFEPLTFESVMEIVRREKPEGVIVQFGGQTPLKLAKRLQEAGVPIIGTGVHSIETAEDRNLFNRLISTLGLRQPEGKAASSYEDALASAEKIGFPLMIRPSFVLGGRAMRVINNDEELVHYLRESVEVSDDRPLLLDRFLENAVEVDVDAVSDGESVVIAGIMEHIERAGIHSGDSSCCLPPITLSKAIVKELARQAELLARELSVIGLINVQFAVLDGEVFIIEANPRASRTVPFVSKVVGIPWAKIATSLMVGKKLSDFGISKSPEISHRAVKASVFPFSRFPGVDIVLGPEMRSTGEVMGIDDSFPQSFIKALMASNGTELPLSGSVFMSVRDGDKDELIEVARAFSDLGFKILSTAGTSRFLESHGIRSITVKKVREGSPHVVDLLGAGKIDLVINTPEGSGPQLDSRSIRLVASEMGIPTFTTIAAAGAAVQGIQALAAGKELSVKSIQEYHRGYVPRE